MSGGQIVPWRDVHRSGEAGVWTSADRAVGEGTREAIRAGVNANTERAYTRQQRAFEAWCAPRGRTPLPASPETLAEYAADLAARDYAPASIEQAVAAVRVAHRHAGYAGHPDTTAVELILAGHREARARAGRRAKKARVLERPGSPGGRRSAATPCGRAARPWPRGTTCPPA